MDAPRSLRSVRTGEHLPAPSKPYCAQPEPLMRWSLARRLAPRPDDDMSEEMRFHVDMEAAELERMGVPRAEARRRALANFGGVRRYTEEGREMRLSWLDDLQRDIRYAARSLRRTPGYAVVVVLTLALGIAANTAIFSVANSVVFRQLPYRDPSRLLVLWDGLDWIGVPEAWITGPEVVRLRERTRSFDGIRLALGANRRTMIATVMREPVSLVALGLVLGMGMTVLGGRAVDRLLYGVRATDPLTLSAVALVLLAIAVAASWIPARRAAMTDAMIALRAE